MKKFVKATINLIFSVTVFTLSVLILFRLFTIFLEWYDNYFTPQYSDLLSTIGFLTIGGSIFFVAYLIMNKMPELVNRFIAWMITE